MYSCGMVINESAVWHKCHLLTSDVWPQNDESVGGTE